METKPWASFCMSTYKRPDFLKQQIGKLLQQRFLNFEIVIADNDPEASGQHIAAAFNDNRVKYKCNGENLGMVKSYNQSIERAAGDYIVMVTDDDPVDTDMLQFFHSLQLSNPSFGLYCGILRKEKKISEIEIISKDNFACEILDLSKTISLHWSSCLFKRSVMIEIGKLPDYGSGHLVDHALLAMAGSKNGAVVVNKLFSQIQLHGSNYSKSNFNNYYLSSAGFYNTLNAFFNDFPNKAVINSAIVSHLHKWFIGGFFSLRKFNTINKTDNLNVVIREIDSNAEKILQLPYMRACKKKYKVKKIIFIIKSALGILK